MFSDLGSVRNGTREYECQDMGSVAWTEAQRPSLVEEVPDKGDMQGMAPYTALSEGRHRSPPLRELALSRCRMLCGESSSARPGLLRTALRGLLLLITRAHKRQHLLQLPFYDISLSFFVTSSASRAIL